MRPSVRFEVFKRDGFVCAYCGRRPPDVVLEVDHVVPRASGGGDEPENLITACADCNRGKGARHLDAEKRPAVPVERTEELQERNLQLQAYADAMQESRDVEARVLDTITARWAEVFGAKKTRKGWLMPKGGPAWPSDSSLRIFLKRFPLNEILDAIDVAASRLRGNVREADRYFYGVCWKKIKEPS